jgi:hypothetical protein
MKTAACLIFVAAHLGMVSSAGESLEFKLQTDLYTSLQQVPCTRLMSVSRGSIGCSSEWISAHNRSDTRTIFIMQVLLRVRVVFFICSRTMRTTSEPE